MGKMEWLRDTSQIMSTRPAIRKTAARCTVKYTVRMRVSHHRVRRVAWIQRTSSAVPAAYRSQCSRASRATPWLIVEGKNVTRSPE